MNTLKFETFVDIHGDAFREYLSSVAVKLRKENPDYGFTEEKIQEIYRKYPNVMSVLDSEKTVELSAPECKALLEVLNLRNKLLDMQAEGIYFKGCYDGVGYLKKAGIL